MVDGNIAFFINRTIRLVPMDWQHPKDQFGHPIPLLDRDYYSQAEIQELYSHGATPEDLERGQMPDWSDRDPASFGLCVYETVTEGTPMTPIFANTPEGRRAMVAYCACGVPIFGSTMASREEWAELLLDGKAPALDVVHDQVVVVGTRAQAA